ncbi:MAG: hypothetical protein UH239_06225 [Acutalibacteraceae bacterium]|nr:hypothetical protein [Acutalibacteraceae bacterium]
MNSDTINLLKECNAGCKSATNSMEQVMEYVQNEKLKDIISDYNKQHIKIGDECHNLLNKYGSTEKDPQPMAKAMSFITTEIKMMSDNSSQKAAEIMMDGCNMGIKNVSGYINKYSNADNESKKMADKIVKIEQSFIEELRSFL